MLCLPDEEVAQHWKEYAGEGALPLGRAEPREVLVEERALQLGERVGADVAPLVAAQPRHAL